MATPYDRKIGLVFWKGEAVGENTIAELAHTIVEWAPNAKAVYVKTSDGDRWQSTFDSKQAMAIGSTDDVARWVQVLEDHGLEFHAWCVLKGINIAGEADLVSTCCNVPGVRSMLLDVEDGYGYFAAGAESARNLIQRIRDAIDADFHLGLVFDARGQHPKHIYIEEWLPHVGSLHPMVYHKEFGRTVEQALADAFHTTSSCDLPVFPMLQAYGRVRSSDLTRGAECSFEHGSSGVSYFRLGTIGPPYFRAISSVELPTGELPPPDDGIPPVEGVVVRPGEPGYTDGTFGELPPDQAWQTFDDIHGWLVKYKRTANPAETYAYYAPTLPERGRYQIETFVPNINADTRRALYSVTQYHNGGLVESEVSLDQSIHFNAWAPLGVFDLDPALENSGRVKLTDFSIEQPPRRVAFCAVRWRQVDTGPGNGPGIADGFDAPVGTDAERRLLQIWPGYWRDATGYNTEYIDSAGSPAYHTGADLNLNTPTWNLDRGMPVYAVASGTVTWAGRWGDYWRNIIVVQHDPLPDGTQACTRYAHVENMLVQAGDRVERGQQICCVGESGGPSHNYHLHFDVSTTDVLVTSPGHWPGQDRLSVVTHYVAPARFIRAYRPPAG